MIVFSGWRTLLAFPILGGALALVHGGAGALLGGVLVTVLGFWLNYGLPGRPSADGTSIVRTRYAVFWISVQYWGLAFVALGIWSMSQGR